ncbi:outer membrane protein [Xanthobacter sp. AM11]|uniref:outer membrane protein n=1 Tax=Xanthobacter sp. AM11 TaxID=3380643 RepID=UPI0039BF54FA
MAGVAAVLLLCASGEGRAADPATEPAIDLSRLGKAGDFTLTPPDVSEDAPSGWYLRGDAGFAAATGGAIALAGVPTGLDLDGSGWSVGAGLGYRLATFLRAEASLDYLALGAADSAFGRLRSSATVALASLYWDVITISGFTPYLSAGAGFAINSLDVPAALAPAGNDWSFAWSAGAGVSYALNPRLSLDLGYRYASLGAPGYAGGVSAGELGAHQLRLGVRYMLQ